MDFCSLSGCFCLSTSLLYTRFIPFFCRISTFKHFDQLGGNGIADCFAFFFMYFLQVTRFVYRLFGAVCRPLSVILDLTKRSHQYFEMINAIHDESVWRIAAVTIGITRQGFVLWNTKVMVLFVRKGSSHTLLCATLLKFSSRNYIIERSA